MIGRRLGFALLVLGALALGILLRVEPFPGSAYELARGDVRRASEFGPTLVFYDAANDTTLAVFGSCDHEPCGDAFAFQGDVRDDLPDPILLEPGSDGPITRTQSDVSLSERAGARSGEFAAGEHTVLPPMSFRSIWPPIIYYVVALGASLGGASRAAGARWSALGPLAAGATGAVVAPATWLLFGPLVLLVVLGAAIAAWRFRRTRPGLSVALLCCAVAFVAGGSIANAFYPLQGGNAI